MRSFERCYFETSPVYENESSFPRKYVWLYAKPRLETEAYN